MSELNQEIDVDSLAQIEERIQKTVALVKRLRDENEALQADKATLAQSLSETQKELTDTQAAWEEAQTSNQKLSEELQGLQAERKQVRSRLEILLGQIDQLGGE